MGEDADPLWLTGRKNGLESWFSVGSRLASSRDRDVGKREWSAVLAASARSTGYSTGLLRRFARAAEFLKSFPIKSRPPEAIVYRIFAAVELVERVHKLDQKLGRQFLAGL